MDRDRTDSWPALLRTRPPQVLAISVVLVGLSWATVIAVDVLQLGGTGGADARPWSAWTAQGLRWTVLALAIFVAGYLAGRLARGRYTDAGSFFLLTSLALGVWMLEDAGDSGSRLGRPLEPIGAPLLGIDYPVLASIPFYLVIITLTALAVTRYGHAVWAAPRARGYLLATLVLVATWLLARLVAEAAALTTSLVRAVDGIAIAATGCVFAMVVAFVADLRAGRIAEPVANRRESGYWPRLLSLRPALVLLGAFITVLVMGLAIVAVDVADVGGLADQYSSRPWLRWFNGGPVEVVQWIYTMVAAVAAAYLAGRLAGGRHRGASSFFGVLGIGLALILVEETADVRFWLAEAAVLLVGEEGTILGLHYHVLGTLPVMMLLAFFPVYALLRYGVHIWRAPSTRGFLVAAYALYASSQIMSTLAHVGGFYHRAGELFNQWFFAGRLPVADDHPPEMTPYLIVDSLGEEALEMFAVGCMLAMIVAFVVDLRRDRVGVPFNTDHSARGPATLVSA